MEKKRYIIPEITEIELTEKLANATVLSDPAKYDESGDDDALGKGGITYWDEEFDDEEFDD